METRHAERRLAAILSADVSGYSRLMGEDDEATLRTLSEYRDLQFALISSRRGRVVNAPGDALLAEFSSVIDAVTCAVEIQRALAERNDRLAENRRMEFRIGIHLGDVLVKEGALYGDGVNVAARLEGLADGRGICVSRTVYEQIHRKLDCPLEYMGEYLVKNIAQPIEVYGVRVFPGDRPQQRRRTPPKAWHGAALGAAAVLLIQGAAWWVWRDDLVFHLREAPAKPGLTEALRARLAVKPLSGDLSPGKTFRHCEECPEMAVMPPGSFTMGSPPEEPGHRSEEGPARPVAIPKAFAIARFETTFAQWDACMAAGGCAHRPQDRGWGRGNMPVIYVHWQDAQDYVIWLARHTGHAYRLPSEAEWEYAARAGSQAPFWWGKELKPDQANCDRCGRNPSRQTAPVGSFPPNPFGLFDMHGNVWEWTGDCWNGTLAGAPSGGEAWTSGQCDLRVLRGGAWGLAQESIRAARRIPGKLDARSGKQGFRVAMTLP
jgi:formylglycine-generating enzyme required for sulfatase activity/class 3 adenylate cyclase